MDLQWCIVVTGDILNGADSWVRFLCCLYLFVSMKCLVLITAYLCSLGRDFFSLNLDNWLIKDSSLSEVERSVINCQRPVKPVSWWIIPRPMQSLALQLEFTGAWPDTSQEKVLVLHVKAWETWHDRAYKIKPWWSAKTIVEILCLLASTIFLTRIVPPPVHL